MPQATYDDLAAQGLVELRNIPGVEFPETIFSPGAFDRLNEPGAMEWFIVDPYGR